MNRRNFITATVATAIAGKAVEETLTIDVASIEVIDVATKSTIVTNIPAKPLWPTLYDTTVTRVDNKIYWLRNVNSMWGTSIVELPQVQEAERLKTIELKRLIDEQT